LHDADRILNPALFDGQVRSGSAMALGAALGVRLVHAEDGNFLSGRVLDCAPPTAANIPEVEIPHFESPSPATRLGAEGKAKGTSMSMPVCIANAVAAALGVAEITLQLTSERVGRLMRRSGQRSSGLQGAPRPRGGRAKFPGRRELDGNFRRRGPRREPISMRFQQIAGRIPVSADRENRPPEPGNKTK
jgi:2-furoyl-CoA dehydrogenase large subunit